VQALKSTIYKGNSKVSLMRKRNIHTASMKLPILVCEYSEGIYIFVYFKYNFCAGKSLFVISITQEHAGLLASPY
jgi:hypothetical protein